MPETFKSLLFFLEPRMARSVTGTICSIRLGFVLSMSLVLSSTGSFAWSQPAFLNRPIQATFQRIPLARLISQLNTISDSVIVLDRQIDPTQHVTLTCQGEDLLSVLLSLADETGTELAVLESSAWLVPIGKANSLEAADDERKAALQKLPAHTRRPLSIKQPLQWQAGQTPTLLIEKLLARTKTDNLAVTPDDLSTVIPHDHLAAGSIPPLSPPEQLDLVAMQYNHHLLWKQNPQGASAVLVQFVPLPSRTEPKEHAARQKQTRSNSNRPAGSSRDLYTLRVAAPFDELLQAISQRLKLEPIIDTQSLTTRGINPEEIIRLEIKDATRDQLLDAIVKPLGLTWSIEIDRLFISAGD